MTAYPINFEYDKNDGPMFDGLAETADEARRVMSEILTEAPEPYLATTEAGQHAKTRDEIETWWADEIEAGYCQPIKVWSGWVAEITYWAQ